MMGRTHATSGVVLALATLPLINMVSSKYGFPAVTGYSAVVTAVTAAGGAMSNDFDHGHASAAQSLGPITKVLARIVGVLSGGHRHGTHSLLFVPAIGYLTYFIGMAGGIWYGLWIAFWFAVASAAMHLDFDRVTIRHTLVCLVGGLALVYFTSTQFVPPIAAAYGMSIGALAHILGDMLTKEGCPLFWPIVPTRFRFAALTTGKRWETFWLFWTLNVLGVVLVLMTTGYWNDVVPFIMSVPRRCVGLFDWFAGLF